MPLKKVIIIIILYVLIIYGKICAHIVLYICRSCTTKNIGIMPPLKNIVMTIIVIINDFNAKCLRVTTKAPINEIERLRAVPAKTRKTVTKNERVKLNLYHLNEYFISFYVLLLFLLLS